MSIVDQDIEREVETDYHDRPEMSYSKLKVLCESPRLYEAQYITRTMKRPSSDAMDIGTVVHSMLCEPSKAMNLAIIPEHVLAKGGKRQGNKWDDFAAENEGKILLKVADYDRASKCVDRVMNHEIAKRFLEHGSDYERELYWTNAESGVDMRCKVDVMVRKARMMIDIKTCADPSPAAFSKAMATYYYFLQAAVYLDAADRVFGEDWLWNWIAVETSEPFRVRCYSIDMESLAAGRELMVNKLVEFAMRSRTNDWSDEYENQLVSIGLPGWALRN